MLLENLQKNFWLYLLVIAMTLVIIFMGGCTKQPERFNTEKNINENISKYCEYIRDDKDFESICGNYTQYEIIECDMWEDKSKCEEYAQSSYQNAISGFSVLVNRFYNLN